MPRFSIVMPCYNAAEYMRASIEDVINQSFSDFELILVNDASTDDTGEIATGYANINPKIKAINKPSNSGPGPTRNVGIDEASGDYILFLDCDDRYERDLLFSVDIEIKKNNPDVVCYSLIEEYEKNGKTEYSYTHSLPDELAETKDSIGRLLAKLERETMLGYPWNKAYRLDIIKDNHIEFPDIVHIEDILFNIAFMDRVKSLCVTQKPLYHYKNGGTDGVTAKYLPEYFSLQKQRVCAFLEQQDRWETTDRFVLETAAGVYFRSFVSFLERECAHGVGTKAIIEAANNETGSELFTRLKDYVGGGLSGKYIYAPLSKGKVKSTLLKVRIISFVKRSLPALFSRLKQSR